MAIEFQCECGKTLSVPDEKAGTELTCDACGRSMTAPEPEATEAEPAEGSPQTAGGAEELVNQMQAFHREGEGEGGEGESGPVTSGVAATPPGMRDRRPQKSADTHLTMKKVLYWPALVVGLICLIAGGYQLVRTLPVLLGGPPADAGDLPVLERPDTWLDRSDPAVQEALEGRKIVFSPSADKPYVVDREFDPSKEGHEWRGGKPWWIGPGGFELTGQELQDVDALGNEYRAARDVVTARERQMAAYEEIRPHALIGMLLGVGVIVTGLVLLGLWLWIRRDLKIALAEDDEAEGEPETS